MLVSSFTAEESEDKYHRWKEIDLRGLSKGLIVTDIKV